MKVKYKKNDKRAVVPTKDDGDNAYDLYPVLDDDIIIVKPGESYKFDTKIAIELPKGYAMFICNRGSRGSLGLVYGAHVIDESYRGNIVLDLHNISNKPILVSDGDEESLRLKYKTLYYKYDGFTVIPKSKPIAQGAIIKTETVEFVESSDLSDTERGSGSFGHTDSKR